MTRYLLVSLALGALGVLGTPGCRSDLVLGTDDSTPDSGGSSPAVGTGASAGSETIGENSSGGTAGTGSGGASEASTAGSSAVSTAGDSGTALGGATGTSSTGGAAGSAGGSSGAAAEDAADAAVPSIETDCETLCAGAADCECEDNCERPPCTPCGSELCGADEICVEGGCEDGLGDEEALDEGDAEEEPADPSAASDF